MPCHHKHKSGSLLDLIYTRNCVADNGSDKPLHISDHFFITLSSSLPSTTLFSSLEVNAATDTLCSTLTSCLDNIRPLSSRPARSTPLNPWLSDVLRKHQSELRAAERKWCKSKDPSDLSMYQSLVSSFSAQVHTAKSSYFHKKINNAPDTRRFFRVAWGGEVSKAHHLVTGVPQGSVLGPLLFSIYTTSLGNNIQAHGFSYHCYADDTQLHLSFQPDDPTVAAQISDCLVDISAWMKEQLNLAKTELLVFPATPTLQQDFTIHLGLSTITPSSSARNLGVIFDDQLTFKDHIAKTARFCRFALHNIRKIRPFLTEQATQLLVQALVISRLDYCNALLADLPSCTIKLLQMIQNAAARLVFNELKRAHVTPLFITLHWLPVAACIKFKSLMLEYRTATGSAPAYLHSLLPIYTPSRTLRSASERRLVAFVTEEARRETSGSICKLLLLGRDIDMVRQAGSNNGRQVYGRRDKSNPRQARVNPAANVIRMGEAVEWSDRREFR
ncbi:hypothetical protein H4Q32_028702 [Labeo rohita]|uniref:Reverse transcriptase domain-containing protein n=1 Tax=Labeo rohita TaxID=84645 RepID=A0ABQ8L4K1_LABRO|nr:hypothetical protein H4Q32_028702 [Labeo rohita]